MVLLIMAVLIILNQQKECVPIRGSVEAISRLSQNGYRIVGGSNQSGISSRKFTSNELNDIH